MKSSTYAGETHAASRHARPSFIAAVRVSNEQSTLRVLLDELLRKAAPRDNQPARKPAQLLRAPFRAWLS